MYAVNMNAFHSRFNAHISHGLPISDMTRTGAQGGGGTILVLKMELGVTKTALTCMRLHRSASAEGPVRGQEATSSKGLRGKSYKRPGQASSWPWRLSQTSPRAGFHFDHFRSGCQDRLRRSHRPKTAARAIVGAWL